jgi:hypothetical protein
VFIRVAVLGASVAWWWFICDGHWILIYPFCLLAGRFVGYAVIIYVVLLLLCFCGVVRCGCCRVAAMWRP